METSSDNSDENDLFRRFCVSALRKRVLSVLEATEIIPYRVVSPEEVAELRAAHRQQWMNEREQNSRS